MPLAAQLSAAMSVAIEDEVTSEGQSVVDAAVLLVQVGVACTLVFPNDVDTHGDLV